MTATVSETANLEQLDWQKPCDLVRRHPNEAPVATYAMHARSPQPCGCVPPYTVALICRPCLEHYLRGTWMRCPGCTRMLWSPICIAKVVPL